MVISFKHTVRGFVGKSNSSVAEYTEIIDFGKKYFFFVEICEILHEISLIGKFLFETLDEQR